MTTAITKSLGTASRDYSTWAGWIAYLQGRGSGSLVTADEAHTVEAYNDSEFTSAAGTLGGLSGVVTDATRNITIKCAAGQSFADTASNALAYDIANGVGLRATGNVDVLLTVATDNTTVEGLQFHNEGINYLYGGLLFTSNDVLVRKCLGYADGGNNYASDSFRSTGGRWENCAIVSRGGSAGFWAYGAYATNSFKNCTAVNLSAHVSSIGFRKVGAYSTTTAQGCVSMGFGVNFRANGGWSAGTDYNASDQASAPGTNSLSSLTASSQFENVTAGTEDLRVKAGADLIGAGYAGLTTLDIVGQTRSATLPTIGAWEYIVSVAVSSANLSLPTLGTGIYQPIVSGFAQ